LLRGSAGRSSTGARPAGDSFPAVDFRSGAYTGGGIGHGFGFGPAMDGDDLLFALDDAPEGSAARYRAMHLMQRAAPRRRSLVQPLFGWPVLLPPQERERGCALGGFVAAGAAHAAGPRGGLCRRSLATKACAGSAAVCRSVNRAAPGAAPAHLAAAGAACRLTW